MHFLIAVDARNTSNIIHKYKQRSFCVVIIILPVIIPRLFFSTSYQISSTHAPNLLTIFSFCSPECIENPVHILCRFLIYAHTGT